MGVYTLVFLTPSLVLTHTRRTRATSSAQLPNLSVPRLRPSLQVTPLTHSTLSAVVCRCSQRSQNQSGSTRAPLTASERLSRKRELLLSSRCWCQCAPYSWCGDGACALL